jgi:uncharacterized membrane protein
MDAKIAPLQLIVVGFEDPEFKGEILKEISFLKDHNLIKIVDALAVAKDENGEIEALEVSDLPRNEVVEYGAIIGYLIGLGAGDEETAEETALAAAMLVDNEYEYGMDSDELEKLAADIPDGGAALFILMEHLWALPLREAIRGAGGILIAQDFLSPEALMGVGKSLSAAA